MSTDEVYGSIKKGSFKEKDILEPNSPYSSSKASTDLIVRSYAKTFGINAIVLRYCNILVLINLWKNLYLLLLIKFSLIKKFQSMEMVEM